ncbi:MAG: ParB/RepB/Spo0J family partition protein [Bacteroidales bacterium]
MDQERNIKYIKIENIIPHPKNPRKSLTDIEELAESIKENGIMQNLTVVPMVSKYRIDEEQRYYAVIGHRRLAASKLAGLTEVPCVVSDMDEKTQVSIMLMENMQRSDLTIIEEAQGMQMMFDLGSNAEEISEKTGLSKTTVKRRTQLLELDQDKLKESYARGGRIQDYIELQKIKDPDKRNKVMEAIGTINFNWELKRAVEEEKEEENKKKIIQFVEEFAEKIEELDGMKFIRNFRYAIKDHEKPADWETEKYYYHVGSVQVDLFKEAVQEEEPEKRIVDQECEKRRRINGELYQINKQMYEMRMDFIRNYPKYKAKEKISDIARIIALSEIRCKTFFPNKNRYKELLEIGKRREVDDKERLKAAVSDMPEKVLLVMYYSSCDCDYFTFHNWNNQYVGNRDLDDIYEMLQILGYELSEEERQIKNGSHRLYASEDE